MLMREERDGRLFIENGERSFRSEACSGLSFARLRGAQ